MWSLPVCLSFLKNCQSSSPPELAVFQCLQTVALCTLSGINRDRLQEAQFNTKEAIALLEMVCMYLCFFFLFFFCPFFTLHGHIVAWKPDPSWTYYSLIHSLPLTLWPTLSSVFIKGWKWTLISECRGFHNFITTLLLLISWSSFTLCWLHF